MSAGYDMMGWIVPWHARPLTVSQPHDPFRRTADGEVTYPRTQPPADQALSRAGGESVYYPRVS